MRRCIVTLWAAVLMVPGLVQAQPVASMAPEAPAAAQVDAAGSQARGPYLRAYFHVDAASLAAADTFDAVIGSSRVTMRGGGGEALNLWKGLFARVAFSTARATGSRVVVPGDEVIQLGIPLTVRLTPLEIGGGWRFRPVAGGRLVPYAGAGLLRMGYKETSDFALEGEDTATTFTGGVVFGGVEVSVFSWIIAGVEAQYRTVPGALDGGVSDFFGEDNLGGTAVRVLIGIRR